MRTALEHLGMALFARQPDALDARQLLRIANVADETINRSLELVGRHERVDRERGNRLAGIGGLAGLLDEVDHIAAERGAVERAGEEADDQAQAVALVIADRQQMALVGALGVGERLALAIDHPAER